MSEKKNLIWVDGLKAFALIGIILNHFVESFGTYPWFSNPAYNWPDLSSRLTGIFPETGSFFWKFFQFLGYLGDMGPGVFILISGFTLTLSALSKNREKINFGEFYQKRLTRILPLYVVIHLIIIFFGVLLRRNTVDFTSPQLLMSMLGLRFTDDLFFFLNPSWWFIWLIFQLYIVFPILFAFLSGRGIRDFLFLTILITLLSRLAGLLNIGYSNHLEYWMTGIFFGTRLFEFAFGMILAKLFFEKKFDPWKIETHKVFIFSGGIYLIGFTCSLFYWTTLFSGALITIGLSGLFLAICKFIDTYLNSFLKPIQWIGLVSFPVFLIHQPFILWSARYFSGTEKALILGLVILLSFPAGMLIEKIVNRLTNLLPGLRNDLLRTIMISSFSLQLIANIAFFLTENNLIYRFDVVLFLVNISGLLIYILFVNKTNPEFRNVIFFHFLVPSILFLFVLANDWFAIYWFFTLILLTCFLVVSYFAKNKVLRLLIPYSIVTVLLVSAEIFFNQKTPIEVNQWGEMASLQKDTLTIYSLIPNRKTHLKYNNYDYYVKTNSLGFNGPEFSINEKTSNELRILIIGDAFTMPEGMEYEKAYPELLQKNLSEKFPDKKVTVFNGGITGFGPIEMYSQLKKYIDVIEPDIYINQVFINEFEEINLTPEQRLNSIGLLDQSPQNKLFPGWQIPAQIKSLYHRILKDNVYQNYTYYKSLAYLYNIKSKYYSDNSVDLLRKYLRDVKLLSEQKNCSFFVLYAPGQLEISTPRHIAYYPDHLNLNDSSSYNLDLPRFILKKLCNENQVPFLDPKDYLLNFEPQPVYFTGSWHWNEEGHKAIAHFLANNLSGIN